MPPPDHPAKPPRHKTHRRQEDVSTDFVVRGALEELLRPFVPAKADRAFLARCLVEEGPAHHRGANDVLLRLLDRLPQRRAPDPASCEPVPMHLPPHLQDERDDGDDDDTYPIGLPVRLLRLLSSDEGERRAMAACLTHGPPQHVLANVVMLALIDRALPDDDLPNVEVAEP